LWLALRTGLLQCIMVYVLIRLMVQVGDEHNGKPKEKTLGGFFSALKGRGHWSGANVHAIDGSERRSVLVTQNTECCLLQWTGMTSFKMRFHTSAAANSFFLLITSGFYHMV
jgi:hypothetical protein